MNSERMEIIAVIQGPVKSAGRTFETSGIGGPKKSVNESDLVIDFDSSSTILENTKKFKSKGIKVIYSGWLNDCLDSLKSQIEKAGANVILSSSDNAPSIVEKNSPFKGVLSINNKSKQFYSLFQALNSIDDLSKYIVIKIRSDISVNIDRLIAEINRLEGQIKSGAILVQYLQASKSSEKPTLWIPDFLFVGRGDVLHHISKDLLDRSLNDNSYSDSPHIDLGNAILHYHSNIFPNLSKKNESITALMKRLKFVSTIKEFWQRFAKYILTRKMISLYQNGLLIPAVKGIQHSIVWRGDSYGKFIERHKEADNNLIYDKEKK
jgi:hypothetical protein